MHNKVFHLVSYKFLLQVLSVTIFYEKNKGKPFLVDPLCSLQKLQKFGKWIENDQDLSYAKNNYKRNCQFVKKIV